MQAKMFTSTSPYQPIGKSSSIPACKHILDQSTLQKNRIIITTKFSEFSKVTLVRVLAYVDRRELVITSVHFAVTPAICDNQTSVSVYPVTSLSFYTQTYHPLPYLQ